MDHNAAGSEIAQTFDSFAPRSAEEQGEPGSLATDTLLNRRWMALRARSARSWLSYLEVTVAVATLVSIIVALYQFNKEQKESRTARVGSAWELIIASSGIPGDFGRREALEVIRSSDRHSLRGIQLQSAILPRLELQNEVMTSASFVGAMLDTARFSIVTLDSVDGRHLKADSIVWSQVSLHGARLDSAILSRFAMIATSGSPVSVSGGRWKIGRIHASNLYLSPADSFTMEGVRIDSSRIQLRGTAFQLRQIHASSTEIRGAAGLVSTGDFVDVCLLDVRMVDFETDALDWSLVTIDDSELTDLLVRSGNWNIVGLWNTNIHRSELAEDVLVRMAGDSTVFRDVTILPSDRPGLNYVSQPVHADSGYLHRDGITLFRSNSRLLHIPIEPRQHDQAAAARKKCVDGSS